MTWYALHTVQFCMFCLLLFMLLTEPSQVRFTDTVFWDCCIITSLIYTIPSGKKKKYISKGKALLQGQCNNSYALQILLNDGKYPLKNIELFLQSVMRVSVCFDKNILVAVVFLD